MGFFDSRPPAGPDESRPEGRPWCRPETGFARVAASGLLLGRTDDVAVAVTAVWAYRDGSEFWLRTRFRLGDAMAGGPDDPVDDASLHIGLRSATAGRPRTRERCRWRSVSAPHLVALVRAGARFEHGVLVERPEVVAA